MIPRVEKIKFIFSTRGIIVRAMPEDVLGDTQESAGILACSRSEGGPADDGDVA